MDFSSVLPMFRDGLNYGLGTGFIAFLIAYTAGSLIKYLSHV